jgi:hypothetical protein
MSNLADLRTPGEAMRQMQSDIRSNMDEILFW